MLERNDDGARGVIVDERGELTGISRGVARARARLGARPATINGISLLPLSLSLPFGGERKGGARP